MLNSTRKRMEAYRSSIRNIGVAFLSPGAVSDGGGEDQASTPMMVIENEDGDDNNMMTGIRSFISKLGVESDRFHPLDQDGECDSQCSGVVEEWKREDSSSSLLHLGNKENDRRNSRPSPQPSKLPFYTPDDKEPSDRTTTPQTNENGLLRVRTLTAENGLHRVPTPLGSTRAAQSRNPTPRGAVLTPRSTSFGFTTPRAIPTFGPPARTNSTITPISEDKVLHENGFQEREPDSLLPMQTFSFEDVVKNELPMSLGDSSSQNSPETTTHSHEPEPEPVISPRGELGPLYLVPSIDTESGTSCGTAHEPEPVESPKGKSGPLYLQTTHAAEADTIPEDPYEWAYEIWRACGLMPAKAKPLLSITSDAHTNEVIVSSLGTSSNRDLTVVEQSPTSISDGSRRTRFANVRQRWEEKSKDKVNSPFLSAQYEHSPPCHPLIEPDITEYPSEAIVKAASPSEAIVVAPSPSEAIVLASSASELPVAIRPSPQTQLSAYVSKYSPPRPSTSRRKKLRCSLDKSEAIYNDGSEPFVRQASARAQNKRGRAQLLLQHDVERKPDVPCLEIVVTNKEPVYLSLPWHEDNAGQNIAGDGTSGDLVLRGDNPLAGWQSPYCNGTLDLAVDQRDDYQVASDDKQLVRQDDSAYAANSGELVPYDASQLDVDKQDERCLCGNSFVDGHDNLVNFFLPRLDIGCSCGQNHVEFDNPDEPTALENILRPWQCEFLRSFGIWKGDQLVKAHHRSAGFLAKGLKHWRIDHQGLPGVRTRSCVMALSIWSRSCKVFVRAVRLQLSEGRMPLERPNILGSLSQFLQQLDIEAVYQGSATPQTERKEQQQQHRKSITSADRRSGAQQAISPPANEGEQVEL